MRPFRFTAPLAVLALALSACSDRVSAPDPLVPPAPEPLEELACAADVRAGTLGCSPARGDGARLTLLGGQGSNVRVRSSDVQYDAATGIFSARVTVQNLTGEAMGAEAGSGGVRVFFHAGPVATAGSGGVEVHNPSGWGTFTAGVQPYFEYAGVLEPGEISPPLRWEWQVPQSVENFAFTLLVAAGMRAPAPSSTLAFRSLSAGGQNACGVTLGGDAYCWGYGIYGQLGAGVEWIERAASFRPVKVLGGPMDTVTVGEYGACGLRGGQTFCWGSNHDAALATWGHDDWGYEDGCAPEHWYSGGCAAPTRSAFGYTFRSISSGGSLNRTFGPPYSLFHCGVDAEGKAFCWGSDDTSQLGDGAQYPIVNPFPVPVAGGHSFARLANGNDHSCAIDTAGRAYCWGAEQRGEIGSDTSITSAPPRPMPVLGGMTFRDIDASHHNSCGVTTGGEAWCWGSNYFGQLGTTHADTTPPLRNCGDWQWPLPCATAPVRVEGGHTFRQITTGEYHTCALDTSGAVWCWGALPNIGRDDVAGEERCTPRTDTPCVRTPVRVKTEERFVWVEAGRNFTCALAEDRRVWCWGGDSFGTGQGAAGPTYVPRPIVGPQS